MSKRYPGNFITGNPVALSQTSNNGIWDVTDVSAAVAAGTWQEPDGIYEIPKSLRFRSSATAYLNRTPTTAGNRRTWTFSAWIKRCNVSNGVTVHRSIFSAYSSGNTYSDIAFAGTNQDRLRIYQQTSGVDTWYAESNMYFRDPSAWYHIVVAYDNTLANANDRIKLYVNGVQQTFASYTAPAQNTDYLINSTNIHYINYIPSTTPNDMYMAETNFIDGQALDPSYFGYFDPITNIWQPKKYTGTYGTNGFYLPFTEPVATSGTVNAFNLGRNFAGGTNYIRYSQDGSQTAYGYVYERASNTVNNTTAPDGTTTGNKLTSDGTASQTHRFYCSTAATPSGSTQTTSIYLKYVNCRYVNIENWNGTTYQTQTFDILNGVPAAPGVGIAATGFTSQHVGNGWYRVSVPLYAGSGNVSSPSIAIYLCDASGNVTWNGDSTSAVYWWGAQLNLGTTADPYFKTASTSTITNDWTPTNISITADATYDSMVDSPTNVFTTATDVGGVVPGNYPTWNRLNNLPSSASNTTSYANGNLQISSSAGEGSGNSSAIGTMQIPSTGKWYWEVTITGRATLAASRSQIGIMKASAYYTASLDVAYNTTANAVYVYTGNGEKAYSYGIFAAYGAAWTNGDVIGVACDWDAGTLTFYRNGASQGVAFTGLSGADNYYPIAGYFGTFNINFGQRPFAQTVPTGHKTLNTTNIQALGTSGVGNAAITPHKWFDINLYAGTGTVRDIQNSGFQPDIVWIKKRSGIDNNEVTDSARGDNLRLASNATDTESAGGISIRPNGFNLQSSFGTDNESGYSYIAWQWKQSPTAGLNVISYTGDGTNNRAISHNLNATPAFIITKNRDQAYNWDIYHQSLGIGATMTFNTGLGSRNVSAFGTTAPTSSNFYTQNNYTNTSTNKYVAYLWAEIPGFSKFGSFPGNSSADGPFAYCGFRPKIVIIRSTSASREWNVWDTARGLFNLSNISQLDWGQSHAEYTTAGYNDVVDFLSNGFKLRSAASPNYNGGETYIWAAFAESPFGLNNRAR